MPPALPVSRKAPAYQSAVSSGGTTIIGRTCQLDRVKTRIRRSSALISRQFREIISPDSCGGDAVMGRARGSVTTAQILVPAGRRTGQLDRPGRYRGLPDHSPSRRPGGHQHLPRTAPPGMRHDRRPHVKAGQIPQGVRTIGGFVRNRLEILAVLRGEHRTGYYLHRRLIAIFAGSASGDWGGARESGTDPLVVSPRSSARAPSNHDRTARSVCVSGRIRTCTRRRVHGR
jgi:hypothetical protein